MQVLNTIQGQIVFGIFIFINLFSFFVIGRDKSQAKNGDDSRIPEGVMFFLTTIFGGVGVYIGMFVFRHKTRKWYFQLGIPLLAIQNIIFLYIIIQFMLS